MTPVVLKISESMTDVDCGALDVDSDPNTPPTLLLFVNSEVVATRVGASKESDVVEWLNSSLSKK